MSLADARAAVEAAALDRTLALAAALPPAEGALVLDLARLLDARLVEARP